ncbi:hypothetical protein KW797_01980 [Candidatus Parcubacteria bacterium]|nr:hypothetical protein [Candidatus Parcubacteria bacterium]
MNGAAKRDLRPVGTVFENTYDLGDQRITERTKVIAHLDDGRGGLVEMLQVLEKTFQPKERRAPHEHK